VEGSLISNHQDVVVEAALQGLSILYAYDDERVYDAIGRRQLKRVLADWSTTLPGIFLYYPSRRLPQQRFAPSSTVSWIGMSNRIYHVLIY
jgi:hypothetical protein